MTSHDVVARIRRLSGQRAVGHAGTLDPLASGVLVVLLGKATSLSSYVMGGRKVYAAELVLGVGTNTDDAEGEITHRATQRAIDVDEIESALRQLTGTVLQVPPRFSAVKQGGKRAYAEARQGRDVELVPRQVTIYKIKVLDWQPPRLRMLIHCGSGAYIRSIARDFGILLQSAGYLQTLVRLASGSFRLEDAVPLDELTSANINARLQPMDLGALSFRAAFLSDSEATGVSHGHAVRMGTSVTNPDEVIRLYSTNGNLSALARSAGNALHPFRVFEAAA